MTKETLAQHIHKEYQSYQKQHMQTFDFLNFNDWYTEEYTPNKESYIKKWLAIKK